MHIEPGMLSSAKIAIAQVAAGGLMLAHVPALLKRPTLVLRTLLAATFFSLFMQAFHMKVGPSELHFVGAMPIYLTLGFVPTLVGFALGLLAQGLLFEPQDLVHLSVNTLSLAVPLIVIHRALGRRIGQSLTLRRVLSLDASYYGGVVLMVGFWLAIGESATPLVDWLRFAGSYVSLVLLEPVFTLTVLRAVHAVRGRRWARACFDERLTTAA